MSAPPQPERPDLWERFMSGYDAIFLPRVKARYMRTGETLADVVRARLLVAISIYLFGGLLYFMLASHGHSLTSWLLRVGVFTIYTCVTLAVRFSEDPKYASWAMMIFLVVNSWGTIPLSAGVSTLTMTTTHLTPLIFTIMGGFRLGLLGLVHTVLFVTTTYVMDINGYPWPIYLIASEAKTYIFIRALYLTILCAMLAGIYTSMQDARVVQLKKLNLDLEAAVSEARKAVELKSIFIATMSHEIRTPLNGIIGMAQVLANSKLDDAQRSELHMLATCGESLLNIVNDILDVAKITANKVELEVAPLQIKDVVTRTLGVASIKSHEKRVQLSVDTFGISHVPAYFGDATRIGQVLLNIVTNAVKFTAAGGEVTVKVSASVAPAPPVPTSAPPPLEIVIEGEKSPAPPAPSVGTMVSTCDIFHRITFEVTDTGIGIPKDRIQAVFEPFTQNDASTTRQHGGTGLGLTISRSLARLMGGDVTVTSVVGVGSSFTFEIVLPVAPQLGSIDKTLLTLTPPYFRPLNYNVLFLDDCLTHARIINRMLQQMGCSVMHVTDSKGALQALEQRQVGQGCFDWIIVNTQTFNQAKDASKLAFVLYLKEQETRPQHGAKPVHTLLLRDRWAQSSTSEYSLRLEELKAQGFRTLMCMTKPVEFAPFAETLAGLSTPHQSFVAPPLPPSASVTGSDGTPSNRSIASPVMRRIATPPAPRPDQVAPASLSHRTGSAPTHETSPEGTHQHSSMGSDYSSDMDDVDEDAAHVPRASTAMVRIHPVPPIGNPSGASARPRSPQKGVGSLSIGMMESSPKLRSLSSDPYVPSPTSALSPSSSGELVSNGTRPPSSSAQQQQQLRILLVEDNPTNQQVVLRLLKILGHTCDIANNGQEAVDMVTARIAAHETLPNMILMDLHMPIMGGIEAGHRIRNLLKDIGQARAATRIVAVSADAVKTTRDSVIVEEREIFDGFLAKPFLLVQLKEAMTFPA